VTNTITQKWMKMGFAALIPLALLSSGCDLPQNEGETAVREEPDAENYVYSDEEFEAYFEAEDGPIGAQKADSASVQKTVRSSGTVATPLGTGRPVFKSEAIGHGTPQPWKPGGNESEQSEENSEN
jgi:hypothetical protein